MDSDLFQRLLYALHEAEIRLNPSHPPGSAQFCPDCRARAEHLEPVAEEYAQDYWRMLNDI